MGGMDEVDKVKAKLDLVDIISEYLPLKKAGRNFKANCPFHHEKSPSFVISPERQIWHCFGCQKGGDMFTFMEEYEHIDFSESLKILAEKANVTLSKPVFKTKKEEQKAKIYEINHLAAQFYHYLLTEHASGKAALVYVLEKRGVKKAVAETFMLGYAPNQMSALSKYLTTKKGYTTQELVEAGVSVLRQGRLMDFFQNRLIFPIQDSRGNIIAFSGRALREYDQPKYINTRETPVYVKGDTVFGILQAKEGIKREQKVILMEGEFDVISSFQEGITNTVAVKGTALTESQIKLLKRFTQKIVFCFDTDPAGTQAQKRSIGLIAKEGISAAVVIPPEGKDADELLRQNPGLFKKALKEEKNIYDYIIETALSEENPKTAEGKKNVLLKTLPYLVDIENEIVKEHYLKKTAQALDSTFDAVSREAEKLTKPSPVEIKKPFIQKKNRPEMLEQHLLTLILQSENPKENIVIASSIVDAVPMTNENIHKLFIFLKEYFQTHEELSVSEINQFLDIELIPVFDYCLLAPLPPLTTIELYRHEVEKTAREVKMLSVKTLLNKISEKIKLAEKGGKDEDISKLQQEFDNLASRFKPTQ